MRKLLLAWTIVFVGFGLTGFSLVDGKKQRAPHVLIISVDGLRPEFYLHPDFEAPQMRALMAKGAYADASVPVFPSVTYPNHTSLITGVHPAKHGILSNTVFTWEAGPTAAWYWENQHLKVPTILDLATRKGLVTSSLRWPVTLNANATYLVPEIFEMEGFYEGTDWQLTSQYTDVSLMAMLSDELTAQDFEDHAKVDQWVARSGERIQKQYQPDLMLVHLAEVDHVMHETGRDSVETKQAVKRADDNIGTILQAINTKNTCVFIVGDHGFFNVDKSLKPNVLFLQNNWLHMDQKGQITDWQVVAHASGGQAAIYTKDKTLIPEIEALLKKNAHLGYQIISHEELAKWGAYPDAVMAISARDGFTVSGSAAGDVVGPASIDGQHGHLPIDPQLYTGFIAAGCGIAAGQKLGIISNLQLAPTVDQILQLQLGVVDASALTIKGL